MDVYIQSPIRLHDTVLNWLSTGTALPLPLQLVTRALLPFLKIAITVA
jgi:hypothetical protein